MNITQNITINLTGWVEYTNPKLITEFDFMEIAQYKITALTGILSRVGWCLLVYTLVLIYFDIYEYYKYKNKEKLNDAISKLPILIMSMIVTSGFKEFLESVNILLSTIL